MKRYVLDTNIYIEAIRSPEARGRLAAWQRAMAPYVHQHVVVISELLVGAGDAEIWDRWYQRWIVPAERVGRVLSPSYGTWLHASRIIARLAGAGEISVGGVRANFYNDCLLAASARADGFVVVTHNRSDFDRIRLVEPDLRVTAPFP